MKNFYLGFIALFASFAHAESSSLKAGYTMCLVRSLEMRDIIYSPTDYPVKTAELANALYTQNSFDLLKLGDANDCQWGVSQQKLAAIYKLSSRILGNRGGFEKRVRTASAIRDCDKQELDSRGCRKKGWF